MENLVRIVNGILYKFALFETHFDFHKDFLTNQNFKIFQTFIQIFHDSDLDISLF